MQTTKLSTEISALRYTLVFVKYVDGTYYVHTYMYIQKITKLLLHKFNIIIGKFFFYETLQVEKASLRHDYAEFYDFLQEISLTLGNSIAISNLCQPEAGVSFWGANPISGIF